MKAAIALAISLALTGCVTEPAPVTQDHAFDCVYVVESDSTVTPVCHGERVK